MSILDIINKGKQSETVDPNRLNVQELEFLLNMLKNSTIRGEQVEMFYGLVVKIQNQYLSLTNK